MKIHKWLPAVIVLFTKFKVTRKNLPVIFVFKKAGLSFTFFINKLW